jgi:hypothetical protein
MTAHADQLLKRRKERFERILGRSLELRRPEGLAPLSEREWAHLREDAEDLYWNELEWENVTQEEGSLAGQALTEMAFPGFLALVRGLLLEETMPDALAEAAPRPEVVEAVLDFLARRTIELGEAMEKNDAEEPARVAAEHMMTSQLVDLTMAQLYALSPEEQKRVKVAADREGVEAKRG